MNYQRLYEYRFRGIDQDSRNEVWKEIAPHIAKELGQPRRILDPAAGRGEFINNVPAEERWAIDMVAYEEGTHDEGVKVMVSDIFDAELPADYFDGIFVSNFMEHLLSQEAASLFLERMCATVKPGGKIAIMGPNFRYTVDEYFDMADHTLIFTHMAMAEHLYTAGFEPIRIVPRFLPYSFRGKLPPSRTLTRHYLKMPFAWRFLGKQFLLIGERQ